MNPRNLVNPRRIEENLRMGPEYEPRPVRTFFAFADKQGSFNRAVDGAIGTWAGLAGAVPALTDFMTQTPGLRAR